MGEGETLTVPTKLPASVLSLLIGGEPRPEAAVSIPAVVPEERGSSIYRDLGASICRDLGVSICRDPGDSSKVLRGDLPSAPLHDWLDGYVVPLRQGT